jgi:hypothetical protein
MKRQPNFGAINGKTTNLAPEGLSEGGMTLRRRRRGIPRQGSGGDKFPEPRPPQVSGPQAQGGAGLDLLGVLPKLMF